MSARARYARKTMTERDKRLDRGAQSFCLQLAYLLDEHDENRGLLRRLALDKKVRH